MVLFALPGTDLAVSFSVIKLVFSLILLIFSLNVPAAQSQIRLHTEGATALAARLQSIAPAQQLDIETFYLENDRAGRLVLKTLLAEKSLRPSFKIRLLLDSWGSETITYAMACTLQNEGIEIKFFNKNGGIFNQQRTHRKIWVTDRTAFVGGRNISDENFSESGDELSDWDVEIRGDEISKMQSSFLQAWNSPLSTGPECEGLPAENAWLTQIKNESDWSAGQEMPAWSGADVSWHTDSPGSKQNRPVSAVAAKLLGSATRSIEIENAYFLPVSPISDELGSAKEKGLRVQFYLNGPKTDMWMARYSSCLPLNEIQWWIDTGAKVSFTPQNKRTHAKSIFVDDSILAIGSFNFDSRSINANAETLLVIRNAPEIFTQYRHEHNRRMESGHLTTSVKDIFTKYGLNNSDQRECLGISTLKPVLKNFF